MAKPIADTDLALEVLVVQVIAAASEDRKRKLKKKDVVLDKMLKDIKIMFRQNEIFFFSIAEMYHIDKLDQEMRRCFADGRINWGRIVAIFALLYAYARQKKSDYPYLRALTRVFTKFLLQEVAQWIKIRGGFSDYVNPCNHLFCIAMCYMLGIYTIVALFPVQK